MNKLRLIILWILILGIMPGCGSGSRGTTTALIFSTDKGKVIPKVFCNSNHTVTYALFLPATYNPGVKYPVIIAFDPQANGILPLEKYSGLADKYNYILMGSNDSKNGQDMNTAGVIIDALLGETTGRYSIDSSRIYTMGFSGGARIASMIGLYNGGIAGVIGCGAGFASNSQPPAFMPDYISMAGNADFNMNELINLDKQLDQAGFTHASIIFNGGHSWPPADVMENAFIWNDFCSMRKGIMTKNESMIESYIRFEKKEIENDRKNGDALAEHGHLVNLIRFINKLSPTSDFDSRLAELDSSPAYKSRQKELEHNIGKEMKEQQVLNDNFFSKDIQWWKRKVSDFENRILTGKDSNDVRMYKRLKSYLSLLCYMSYTHVLSAKDTAAASHAMEIYTIVDPENAANTKAGKAK